MTNTDTYHTTNNNYTVGQSQMHILLSEDILVKSQIKSIDNFKKIKVVVVLLQSYMVLQVWV